MHTASEPKSQFELPSSCCVAAVLSLRTFHELVCLVQFSSVLLLCTHFYDDSLDEYCE